MAETAELVAGARAGQGWLCLSDHALPDPGPALLDRGTFVLELALPLVQATVLLDYRARDGWARALSVSHDLAAGLVVTHLQGRSLMRHVLPGPLPKGEGIGRLTFAWDAPQGFWTLRFEIAGHEDDPTASAAATGARALPLHLADLVQLCQTSAGSRRHPSVLWFGVTPAVGLPPPRPWLGPRTSVETASGPVPAARLRPGDMILTLDRGLLPVLRTTPVTVPAAGSLAPVLLRAPYFGQSADLLVSADQHVLYADVAVQYLFGEDEVLIRADDLCDGVRALPDRRRPVVTGIEIDLGAEALLMSDGCAFSSAAAPRDRWGHAIRRLDRAEALAMRAMHRTRGRNLAA